MQLAGRLTRRAASAACRGGRLRTLPVRHTVRLNRVPRTVEQRGLTPLFVPRPGTHVVNLMCETKGGQMRKAFIRFTVVAGAVAALLGLPAGATAMGTGATTVATDFVSPLFGLNVVRNGHMVVADAAAAPTRVQADGSTQVRTSLPGTTDIEQAGPGSLWVTTSKFGPGSKRAVWRVENGHATMVANLWAFEKAVDPANDGPDSNPFNSARLGDHQLLVSDAAGNSIVVVSANGDIDWVASLPQHSVLTRPVKELAGCPDGPADICDLPSRFDADPVATSVAVGADGAYYAGELTGFPGTPGTSRIWRIEPGARHTQCGNGVLDACRVVGRGFTSIVDLTAGPGGWLYVTELDENSWLSVEGAFPQRGGTIDACRLVDGALSCHEVATGLNMVTGTALRNGKLYATID